MVFVAPVRNDCANIPWTFLMREFVNEAGMPMRNHITKHLKNCLNFFPTINDTSFPSKEAIFKVIAAFTPSKPSCHVRYCAIRSADFLSLVRTCLKKLIVGERLQKERILLSVKGLGLFECAFLVLDDPFLLFDGTDDPALKIE